MPLNLKTTPSNSTAVKISLQVAAPPARIFQAFFDPTLLRAWWQVSRSVAVPRLLGPYVLEWEVGDTQDDVLARVGGVLRGTIMHVEPDRAFFAADVFWLPLDEEPIGPMALDVSCVPVNARPGAPTEVLVAQTGFEESARWRRYYELAEADLVRALTTMKELLEVDTEGVSE